MDESEILPKMLLEKAGAPGENILHESNTQVLGVFSLGLCLKDRSHQPQRQTWLSCVSFPHGLGISPVYWKPFARFYSMASVKSLKAKKTSLNSPGFHFQLGDVTNSFVAPCFLHGVELGECNIIPVFTVFETRIYYLQHGRGDIF